MYKKCIICDNDFIPLTLNKLEVRKCINCGLVWRKDFDIDEKHYQVQGLDKVLLSDQKIINKINNMIDRVKLFKKYVDLNNLCDIGTGRGLFLKVLQDAGYKNIIGIEPNSEVNDFYKDNNLNIYNGTIENDTKDILLKHNINTITMFHVIEHIVNPAESLQMIYKSMAIENYLILETPDIDSYSFIKLKYNYKLVYPEHLFYFNSKNLIDLLKKTGFKVIASGKRDFNPRNFSIRESLFRLGLLNINNISESNIVCNEKGSNKNIDVKNNKNNFKILYINKITIFLKKNNRKIFKLACS